MIMEGGMSNLSVSVPLSAFPFRSITFELPNRLYPFGSAFGFPLSAFRSLLHHLAQQPCSRHLC